MNPARRNFNIEQVTHTANFCPELIDALIRYCTDHYEEGGHWVVETFDRLDFAAGLMAADYNMEWAQADLKKYWDRQNMLEREYAFGDEPSREG